MLFHDWNDSTDWMNCKVKLTHTLSGLLSQITVDSTLNRPIQHHALGRLDGSFTTFNRCFNSFLHFTFRHVWSTKDIEHRSNIDTNRALKFNDFLNINLDITVHIGLECTRIGHDDTRIVNEVVNALFQSMFLQILMLPNDV